jgi:hypothetical protein
MRRNMVSTLQPHCNPLFSSLVQIKFIETLIYVNLFHLERVLIIIEEQQQLFYTVSVFTYYFSPLTGENTILWRVTTIYVDT